MSSLSKTKLQDILARTAASRGFNAIEGTILGHLLLHPSPMTQREIAKAVGRSQSTVSRALQRMTKRGAVNWTRKKGLREMIFSTASENSKGLIFSGIIRWVKTSSILRDELKLIVKEHQFNDESRVGRIANDMIEAIDYVEHLLNPIILTLEEEIRR